MVRNEALVGLHRHAENGGILVPPNDLRRARVNYEQVRTEYEDAQRRLVESTYPRHYRVVVWGSARLNENTPEYAFTRDLAEALVSRTGCDIITGGGPGIMQAAPEGAVLARQRAEDDGRSLASRTHGYGIELPFEEAINPALDHHTEHSGFSTRLDEFLATSNAVYVAPGGIGSALELLMPIQLKQVGHLEEDFPIIVHPFWRPILDAMNLSMYAERVLEDKVPLVNDGDFGKIVVTDKIPEIVDMLASHHDTWKENIHSKVKRQKQGKLF